ncbi:outer membrane protein assembly factor BamE [Algicella marina]|uniref:Outer membrane protein assembly factor BamE n=1 Tax=Algicella marina TaxID=2683284 RepID=A0A6P1SXJ8_9RHOB|nr:outer membrane protein assembly factor BamE [Algicella marina]QHQ34275.1 outer membrane protein assembly factor BamE [Algicella marina]
MKSVRARMVNGGFALAGLALSACAPQVSVHGYTPSDDELQMIEPGVDSLETVQERIGRPANSGLLRGNTWYYIQSRMEQLTYNPPRETDREIVRIVFTDEGLVESIDRFGLEDGRVIDLNTRVTVTDTGQLGVFQQIFGNILNFNAEQLFGD